jgi:hypothetical protein
LIIEVRTAEDNQQLPVSQYWTAFGLYDPMGNLNRGRWRVPLYATPTNPLVQMANVPRMEAVTPTELTIRIGDVGSIEDA